MGYSIAAVAAKASPKHQGGSFLNAGVTAGAAETASLDTGRKTVQGRNLHEFRDCLSGDGFAACPVFNWSRAGLEFAPQPLREIQNESVTSLNYKDNSRRQGAVLNHFLRTLIQYLQRLNQYLQALIQSCHRLNQHVQALIQNLGWLNQPGQNLIPDAHRLNQNLQQLNRRVE